MRYLNSEYNKKIRHIIRSIIVIYNPIPPYKKFPSWKWRLSYNIEKFLEKTKLFKKEDEPDYEI